MHKTCLLPKSLGMSGEKKFIGRGQGIYSNCEKYYKIVWIRKKLRKHIVYNVKLSRNNVIALRYTPKFHEITW